MAQSKIHCDLLRINGVEFADTTADQVQCIIAAVQQRELFGSEDNLYGFVGTAEFGDVVGGFFIVQFPTEFIHYDKTKKAASQPSAPRERVLFVLFPQSGLLLVQNKHFSILPLDMEAVRDRMTASIAEIFRGCGVGPVVSITPTYVEVCYRQLLQQYQASRRVNKLRISNPDPSRIPRDITYYNPEISRNEILRDSRLHDYPQLSSLEISSKRGRDLRETHIGKDLVFTAGEDNSFMMEYEDDEGERRILRRTQKKTKFEFYVDVEGETLTERSLQDILQVLARETSLDLRIPVETEDDPQLPLFDQDPSPDEE